MAMVLSTLKRKDFVVKSGSVSGKRRGKREYMNGARSKELIRDLYGLFESKVEVPRIRAGERQTVETSIDEEALLLAKFLRDERKTWTPRIAVP